MSMSVDESAQDLYERLLAAADDADEELMTELLQEAADAGIPLQLEDRPEEPYWDDGSPFVEVEYELKLGKTVVAAWQATYSGQYGGGGTGWWIVEISSDQPENVDLILECADIRIEMPDVPSEEEDDTDAS
jgi:hypothetical protein